MRSSNTHSVLKRTRACVVLVLGTGLLLSCAGTGPGEASVADDDLLETVDGLKRAEISTGGRLFIRENAGIGSYDAFLIPEASISYTRASRRLPEEIEEAFLASLEQSLIDAADEAGIPIVTAPGNCVMQVGMALAGIHVDRASAKRIGKMALVMEFRDTVSGEPLLRYATQQEITRAGDGVPRSQQFQEAFDRMVADMEISGPLRAAGLTDSTIRPGCIGRLSQMGRENPPAVSSGP